MTKKALFVILSLGHIIEAKWIFRRNSLHRKHRIQPERPSFSAQGFYALGLLKGIEKMRRKIQSLAIICLLVFGSFLLMVGLISQNAEAASSEVSATTTVGEAFQTWEIVDDEGGQAAILRVDSSGNFTGAGWFGYAPGCDSYDIHITNGRMSGTSMTWEANASYCSGQGTIEARAIGTLLDVSFPGATSATGTWSGTISDPLGTRDFENSWSAKILSGLSGPPIIDLIPIKKHARKLSIEMRIKQGICGAVDTLSDFAVATKSWIGLATGIVNVIKGGLSLNPVTIIAGAVAKAAISAVKYEVRSWCDGIDAQIGAYNKLAEDPPDSNYTEVAEIEPFETFPAEGETLVEVAIVTLTNNMAENQAILKALTVSIERFQGALLANENKYILQQAGAIWAYSDMVVQSVRELTDSFDLLFRGIELIESDPDFSADWEKMWLRLLMEGFTQEEIEYFKGLGATDIEIEDYKEMLLFFDINEFRNEIEELQKTFEEGISLYANLSAQALNVIDTLSGLQSDVNSDDVVDIFDLALFSSHWLNEDCSYPGWCGGADLNNSGKVDFIDLKILVGHWLEGAGP